MSKSNEHKNDWEKEIDKASKQKSARGSARKFDQCKKCVGSWQTCKVWEKQNNVGRSLGWQSMLERSPRLFISTQMPPIKHGAIVVGEVAKVTMQYLKQGHGALSILGHNFTSSVPTNTWTSCSDLLLCHHIHFNRNSNFSLMLSIRTWN